jgi:hypothetical protein
MSSQEPQATTKPQRARRRRDHHLVDDDIATRGGALPRGEDEVPRDTPDTQESLSAEDGAYRVDEDEGHGPRHPTPVRSADDAVDIYVDDEDIPAAEGRPRPRPTTPRTPLATPLAGTDIHSLAGTDIHTLTQE